MRYVLSLLAASVLALTVSAQADNPAKVSPDTGTHPGMGMRGQQGMGMMMNMPDDMMQRCRMMMQTAIAPSDPAAILSLKDDLKLTPEQIQNLQAIANEARQKAKGVLNEQQTETLQTVPAAPDTPMAMHQHMMRMMQQMHGNQDGAESGQMPMMNCPMMNMMGGDKDGAANPPVQGQSGGDHEAHH